MNFTNSSLHPFYRGAQKRHPNVLFYGNPSRREIALTFDDGPHPRDTLRVLDVLDKHRVRATFHLVGKHAEQYPELIQQIHQCGHQLALHCYRHVPFPLENLSTLRIQLENTRQLIADACGISPTTIKDLRPPYGAFNEKTLSHLTEWGYRLVLWSCMPPHWMQPVVWSIRQVMEVIMPGSVIVLHDGRSHGRKVAEILETVIPQIRARGFEFVTVEEMQNQRNPLAAESEARHYNPSKA